MKVNEVNELISIRKRGKVKAIAETELDNSVISSYNGGK